MVNLAVCDKLIWNSTSCHIRSESLKPTVQLHFWLFRHHERSRSVDRLRSWEDQKSRSFALAVLYARTHRLHRHRSPGETRTAKRARLDV